MFVPQHSSGAMDGGSYEQLGYMPTQTAYLDPDPFRESQQNVQREATPLYEGHPQLQSFTHVNPHTPGTWLACIGASKICPVVLLPRPVRPAHGDS